MTPIKPDATFVTQRVWFGDKSEVNLGAGEAGSVTIPRGQLKNLKASYTLTEPQLTAPLKKGQVVGTIDFQLNGKSIEQRPLIVMENVEEGGFFGRMWDFMMMKFHQWFGSWFSYLLITGWRETSSGYTSLIHQLNTVRLRVLHILIFRATIAHNNIKSVSGHPCAPDAPCQICCGRQPAHAFAPSIPQCLPATFKIKTGSAFTGHARPPRNKRDIRANYSTFAEIDAV